MRKSRFFEYMAQRVTIAIDVRVVYDTNGKRRYKNIYDSYINNMCIRVSRHRIETRRSWYSL